MIVFHPRLYVDKGSLLVLIQAPQLYVIKMGGQGMLLPAHCRLGCFMRIQISINMVVLFLLK